MMNFSRKRNRALTPAQSEEVQKLAYELVRERLTKAFGPEGMWSVNLRHEGDTEVLFGQTVAETLALDIAAQLGMPMPVRATAPAHVAPPQFVPEMSTAAPALPATETKTVFVVAPSRVATKREIAEAHAA